MAEVQFTKTKKFNGKWRHVGETLEVNEADLERLQGCVELTLDPDGDLVETEVKDPDLLQEDFPFRRLLLEAGYPTVDSLPIDDLTSIKGIGEASAKTILKHLGLEDDSA